MTRRSAARALALQALFQLDVQGDDFLAQLDDFLRESGSEPAVVDFARELTVGAWKHRDRCDGLISQVVQHWDLSRMAAADRANLRLAVYQLLEADIPARVVINEAIELAKKFSTAESPQFVNGVLDAVSRRLRKLRSNDAVS